MSVFLYSSRRSSDVRRLGGIISGVEVDGVCVLVAVIGGVLLTGMMRGSAGWVCWWRIRVVRRVSGVLCCLVRFLRDGGDLRGGGDVRERVFCLFWRACLRFCVWRECVLLARRGLRVRRGRWGLVCQRRVLLSRCLVRRVVR
jgi:hypothetical protein